MCKYRASPLRLPAPGCSDFEKVMGRAVNSRVAVGLCAVLWEGPAAVGQGQLRLPPCQGLPCLPSLPAASWC